MADISITAANVLASDPKYIKSDKVAGVALTAGQIAYYDADTKTLKLSGNDALAKQNQDCIILCNAAAGQPVSYTRKDPALDIGAHGKADGTLLVVSAAGAMSAFADATTGDWLVVFGVCNEDGTVNVDFHGARRSDVVLP